MPATVLLIWLSHSLNITMHNLEVVYLNRIVKSYDGQHNVLNGIDLTLRTGEMVGILGESGCGKSTLLNVIGLIDGFDSGEYSFLGNRIEKRDYSSIRGLHIGFVFQLFQLIPGLTVRQNLQVPYLYKAEKVKRRNYYEREKELLTQFDIYKLVEQKIDTLSGGEKQRVALARAMMLNPQLLIADEPTGALDTANTQIVIDALLDYSKHNSVILVTHSLEVASHASRILTMSEGVLHDAQ